jgi:hypothetical protein
MLTLDLRMKQLSRFSIDNCIVHDARDFRDVSTQDFREIYGWLHAICYGTRRRGVSYGRCFD